MTVKFSTALRNAILDTFEATIGASPILRIYSGSVPANITDSPGTLLAEMTLPSDWMTAASSGVKDKSGSWSDSSANATGTASHYRIYASDGTTPHEQGTVTATGGGGDMTVDNTSIAAGQQVTVTTYSKTAPHA